MKIAMDVPETVGTLWAGALWSRCGRVVGALRAR